MPIVDEVTSQMKTAMKAKDALRLATLRSMRTAFLNEMKCDYAQGYFFSKAIPWTEMEALFNADN